MPKDAISKHEDFDILYIDGSPFLSFKSDWSSEKDKVLIFGRMGGEMGQIRPDHKALTYYLKLERWEYVLHTLYLFKHYFINGMKWQVAGSMSRPPFNFVNEETFSKEVTVRTVKFKEYGECYEIRAKDPAKLRIAAAAAVAIAIKEEYKGLSEGFKDLQVSKVKKLLEWISTDKGIAYEDLPPLDPSFDPLSEKAKNSE